MLGEQKYSSAVGHPTVSVVVPAYNADVTIDDCVESLLQLDPPSGNFEIIVVDNGSTDTTSERLERYSDRIRILHEKTVGAAAARNAGITHSRGDIVAFTDADCVASHDWLVNLIAPLSDPRVGIAAGAIQPKEHSSRIDAFSQRLYDQRAAIMGSPSYAITANWASPAEILKEVGSFDESMIRGQDYELTQRILEAGYRVVYCEEAHVRISTPRTFYGLFIKGIQHGHAIALIDQKCSSSIPAGTPRTTTLMRRLVRNSIWSVVGNDRFEAVCKTIFNAGKLVGKMRWSIAQRQAPPFRPGGMSSLGWRKIRRASSARKI